MGTSEQGRRPEYGWVADAPAHAAGYVIPAVTRELAQRDGSRVLDIGAGKGALCSHLDSRGYTTVGIDADSGGMRIARETVPRGTFYTLAVEDSPAQLLRDEEQFDAVVSTEVVEHLYAPALLPAFARAVLKPGGVLILTTPYHGYLKNVAIAAAGRWDAHHGPHWVGGHIKFWSRKTLSELLERAGFEVISFTGVGRLPFLWKSMMVVATPVRD